MKKVFAVGLCSGLFLLMLGGCGGTDSAPLNATESKNFGGTPPDKMTPDQKAQYQKAMASAGQARGGAPATTR